MTFMSKILTQSNVYFLTVSKYAQGVQLVSKAPLGGQIKKIIKKKQAKNTIAAVQKIENKTLYKTLSKCFVFASERNRYGENRNGEEFNPE